MTISKWMTRDEVAVELRISKPTVDRWAKSGRLTKHTVPGARAVRFERDEVEALLVPSKRSSEE
jgi:excisionase family DNA binding protein